MKIMLRLSLTNSWLIVVVGSLSCDGEIRGAESTPRRGRMIFFFFFFYKFGYRELFSGVDLRSQYCIRCTYTYVHSLNNHYKNAYACTYIYITLLFCSSLRDWIFIINFYDTNNFNPTYIYIILYAKLLFFINSRQCGWIDELEILIFGLCKDESVKRLSTDSWKFFEIIFESINNLIFTFDKTLYD